MEYTVLTPWAESDYLKKFPLSPRLDSLDGKTIGLYASFKEYHPYLMCEVERQLQARYPTTKFIHYCYKVDTTEIDQDPENYPSFCAWLNSVDGVIGCGADAGSCALYVGYIFAHMEKLGKPVLLLTDSHYISSATRGAASRGYPALRQVVLVNQLQNRDLNCDITAEVSRSYSAEIAEKLDAIVAGLTAPLTDEEQNPTQVPDFANMKLTGTLDELNRIFYTYGWTNGTPIVPPTEEAIHEFLRFTDLPREHVVCTLPPMKGKATVEKIAINGIIAGCLPCYMPVLIAIAKGMADPKIQLEGWTCSNAGWGPMIIVSGPIAKQINMNSGRNLLSPYNKASSSLGRALAYMVMNISGVRSRVEDMSGPGHDGRFGVCFAENIDESPWKPLHTDFGFAEGDSAVTLFWPCEHNQHNGNNTYGFLESVCGVRFNGFDAGLALIIPPENARRMDREGWTKQKLLEYILEYARRPGTEIPRTCYGNNHPRKGMILPPMGSSLSTRRYWNTEHMFIVVAGCDWAVGYIGGGDHGGPSCTRIETPPNWDEIVTEYQQVPNVPLY